jgi:cephalosporin-C deacetylase
MTDAEMFAFLSYYDTKNLATRISCPVITSISLQDNVCPPHTNLAPYNNLLTPVADKQLVINPELQHQVNYSGADNWYTVYMNFFKKYESTTGIREVLPNAVPQNSTFYDLQGRRLSKPARGIYIHNGRKVVMK